MTKQPDVVFSFPLATDQKNRQNQVARGHAQAAVIKKYGALAAKAKSRLILDLTNFDLTRTTALPIEALIDVDAKLPGRVELRNVSTALGKELARAGVPARLLGVAARPGKAQPAKAAKAKPAETAKPARVAEVTALWVVAERAEDAALLAFLKARKVATPKPALALGKQKFEADTDLVWHFFTKEVPVCVATTKAGKPKLEVHRAEPESGVDESGEEYDDYGGKYNQWDFIKPLVEGKPIVVQKDVIYVGFNALQAEVLDGRRPLGK